VNGPEEALCIMELDSNPAGREEVSRGMSKGSWMTFADRTSNHVGGAWERGALRTLNMTRKGKNTVSRSVRAKS